ncbi:hypothetical protein ASE63_00560 [Bosea sp. Root381]|nr:hypothetical protein ASE63_00560 [Bosea sp. Root381]
MELRRALRERDKATEQQDVLNKAILQRMKNTLAMVQAVAGHHALEDAACGLAEALGAARATAMIRDPG